MSRARTRIGVGGDTPAAVAKPSILQMVGEAQPAAAGELPSPSALKPRLVPSPMVVPITVHAEEVTTPGSVGAAPTAATAAAAAAAAAGGTTLAVPSPPPAVQAPVPPASLSTPRMWTPKQRRMSAGTALMAEMAEMDPSYLAMPRPTRRSASCAGGPAEAPAPRPQQPVKSNSYKSAYHNPAFEDFEAGPSSIQGTSSNGEAAIMAGRGLRSGSGFSPPTSMSGAANHLMPAGRKRTVTSGGGAISTPRPSVMRGNLFAEDNQQQKAGSSEASSGWLSKARTTKENVTAVTAFSEASVLAGPASSSGKGSGYGSILATANSHATSSSPLAAGSKTSSAAPSPVPRSWSPAMSVSYTAAAYEADIRSMLGSGQHLEALLRHGPTSGLARCYIKRYKNLLGTHWSCEVYLESWDQLLLAGRRRKKSACSKYLLGLTKEDTNRGADGVVAKLRSDFIGKTYTLWQKGGRPDVKKGYGAQTLAISYKPTATSVKCHSRTLTAALPLPDEEEWMSSLEAEGEGSLAGCLDAAQDRSLPPQQERHLSMLHTIKPFYDNNKKVHYLDFKGRVTKASLKNFQLVHWDHNSNQLGTDIVLLFGKKAEDEYAMDFAYPLNLLQATALALSSIDTKLSTTL